MLGNDPHAQTLVPSQRADNLVKHEVCCGGCVLAGGRGNENVRFPMRRLFSPLLLLPPLLLTAIASGAGTPDPKPDPAARGVQSALGPRRCKNDCRCAMCRNSSAA